MHEFTPADLCRHTETMRRLARDLVANAALRLVVAGEFAGGEATLRVPRSGRYRVAAASRGTAGDAAFVVAPAEIVVGEAGGTFAVELRRP
jgi:hypothetical protein